jgi:hypothetical protein
MDKYNDLDDSSSWVIPPKLRSGPQTETDFISAWGGQHRIGYHRFFGFSTYGTWVALP